MTTYDITVPPEPEGPVWDKDGDVWERTDDEWRYIENVWPKSWKGLLATYGPVTDYPPYKLHQRYVANQLDQLHEGSLLFTSGPYEGVQYVTRIMGKWFAWWPDGLNWVFGEAEKLDNIAPSFSIRRIGWPTIPDGYTGTLSDLLLIGEE